MAVAEADLVTATSPYTPVAVAVTVASAVADAVACAVCVAITLAVSFCLICNVQDAMPDKPNSVRHVCLSLLFEQWSA